MQRVGMEEAEEERLRRAKRENVAEREAFLGWISDLDFEQTHEDIYSAKHPGTGNWLIESAPFKVWLDNPKSTLLWCYGSPGAGKSVLMSNVVEHITTKYGLRKDTGISFAYYNYQMPDLGHPSRIVSPLIKQLCRKMDTIFPELLKFKQDSFHPTFAGTQELFLSVAASFGEVFLIVDALDECPADKRHLIIGFFLKVVDIVPRAKIFVTSRKEPDIAEAFENGETPIIKIEASNVTKDIEIYVKAEVKRLRSGYNGRRLYLRNDVLEEKIISRLTEKAEGMFLWVNLQLENVRSVSEARQDSLIESALEDIPQGLENTYERILRQIDAQHPYMKELACKSFELVLYAKQPLRTAELRDALGMEPLSRSRQHPEIDDIDDVDVIIKACANLLVEENDTVRPIHYSVQEFLTKSPSSTFQGSCLGNIRSPVYVHHKLALTCTSYLLLDVLHHGPCKSRVELKTWLDDHEFLWYAARYFDRHVEALQDIQNGLLQVLERLLNQNSLFATAFSQVRKIENRHENKVPWEFDGDLAPADINAVLYSSPLFNIAQFSARLLDIKVPYYALYEAASNGYLTSITRLIEAGCSIDKTDSRHPSPLQASAFHGHEAIVKLLLEHGAGVNVRDRHTGDALLAASANGHIAIVNLLLDHGAELNAQSTFSGSALQGASIGGHMAIVKLLLAKGANVNSQIGEWGTAIQIASKAGNEALVKLFFEHGADVNAPNEDYGSALQAAVYKDHKAVVKLLLDLGADVNVTGGDYGSALHIALSKGNEGIILLLLDRGAEVNAHSEEYGTPIQIVLAGGNAALVKLLLGRGAVLDAHGRDYSSVLQRALAQGNNAMVRLLLDHGGEQAPPFI